MIVSVYMSGVDAAKGLEINFTAQGQSRTIIGSLGSITITCTRYYQSSGGDTHSKVVDYDLTYNLHANVWQYKAIYTRTYVCGCGEPEHNYKNVETRRSNQKFSSFTEYSYYSDRPEDEHSPQEENVSVIMWFRDANYDGPSDPPPPPDDPAGPDYDPEHPPSPGLILYSTTTGLIMQQDGVILRGRGS